MLIDKYIREIEEHNKIASEPIDMTNALNELLLGQYRDCAAANRNNNKQKSGYFVRTLQSLVLASIFVAIAAGLYYTGRMKEEPSTIHVNVDNFAEIAKMSDDDSPKPEPNPETPAKPVPPSIENVTEADVKTPKEKATTNRQDKD